MQVESRPAPSAGEWIGTRVPYRRGGKETHELSGAPLLLLQCRSLAQQRNLAYPSVSKHFSFIGIS